MRAHNSLRLEIVCAGQPGRPASPDQSIHSSAADRVRTLINQLLQKSDDDDDATSYVLLLETCIQ